MLRAKISDGPSVRNRVRISSALFVTASWGAAETTIWCSSISAWR